MTFQKEAQNKKKIHQNEVKNAPARQGPLPILAESVRLGFIAMICSSSAILSERELKSPIAAGSYCPIFVGSLHSTCTREHKN
jgi:hypothetical protein